MTLPFHATLPSNYPWLRRAVMAAEIAPDTGAAIDAIHARIARERTDRSDNDFARIPVTAYIGFFVCGEHVYDIDPAAVDRLMDVDPPTECPVVGSAFAVELPRHPRLVWEGFGSYSGAFILPPGDDSPPGHVGRYVLGCLTTANHMAIQGGLFGVAPPWASTRSDYGPLDRLLYAVVKALSDRRLSFVTEFPRGSVRRQRLAVGGARSIRKLTLTPDAMGVWETRKIGPVPEVVVEHRAAPAAHLVPEHTARYWMKADEAPADAIERDADGFSVTRQGARSLLAAVRRPVRAHVRGSGEGSAKVSRVVA